MAWLCCYETHERYGKVASALRLRSTSRITALVKECGDSLESGPLLGIAMDRCVDILRGMLQPMPTIHKQSYPGASLQR